MIIVELDVSTGEEAQFANFLEHTLQTLTNYKYSVTIQGK